MTFNNAQLLTVTPDTQPPFSLKIVSLDYYLAPPLQSVDLTWSELEGVALDRVPVVRIFGCTPAGQKACLHLHKAFPYFYVAYDDDLPQDPQEAQAMVRRVASSLDAALNLAAAANAATKGGTTKYRQRVLAGALVKGIPLYGCYPEEKSWIKLLLIDPVDVRKAGLLMLAGAVLNKKWQPYESHIPYLLQVKVDLNLRGMDWLNLSTKILFRHPLPITHNSHRHRWASQTAASPAAQLDKEPPQPSNNTSQNGTETTPKIHHIWTENTTPASMMWPSSPRRQSTCDLELDARVEDVLNRHDLVRCDLKHAADDVRMVESLAPMWEEEVARCNGSVPQPPPSPQREPRVLGAFTESYKEAYIDALKERYQAVRHLDTAVAPQGQQQQQAAVEEEQTPSLPDAQKPSLLPNAKSPLLSIAPAANKVLLVSQLMSSWGSGSSPNDGSAAAAGVRLSAREREERLSRERDFEFVNREIIATQVALAQQQQVPNIVEDAYGEDHEGSSDEDDALLALANQLSAPQTQAPPSSSQDAMYRRAHAALERFLDASQRECHDILEVASLGAELDNLPEQHQNNQQEQEANNPNAATGVVDIHEVYGVESGTDGDDGEPSSEMIIPQIDGADDGEQLPTDNNTTTSKRKRRRSDEIKDGGTLLLLPHHHQQQSTDEGHVLPLTAERIRAASQRVASLHQLLADDDIDIPTARPPVINNPSKNVQPLLRPPPDVGTNGNPIIQEHKTLSIVEQPSDLPPTQPIPSADGALHSQQQHEQQRGGDWWQEDASQIPFEDDAEWDLLDPASWPRNMSAEDPIVHNNNAADNANNDGLPRVWRYRQPPPGQTALEANCWDYGVTPVVAPQLHYGDPKHAPKRPVVFANREFRIPTSSIEELPPFSTTRTTVNIHNTDTASLSALDRFKVLAGSSLTTINPSDDVSLVVFVPVRRPPTREVTNQWLDMEKEAAAAGVKPSGDQGWAMDANTGKLLPTGVAGSDSDDDDMCSTPALPSLPHTNRHRRFSQHQQQQHPSEGGLKTTKSIDRIRSMAISTKRGSTQDTPIDREPRPASPKYDERSFFYDNPFAAEGRMTRGSSRWGDGGSTQLNNNASSSTPDADNKPGDVPPTSKVLDKKKKVVVDDKDRMPPPPPVPVDTTKIKQRVVGGGQKRQPNDKSQISGPSSAPGGVTPSSQLGFKRSVSGKGEGLTLLSVEILADCRGTLLPNPQTDAVRAIIMSTLDDDEEVPNGDYATRALIFDNYNTVNNNSSAAVDNQEQINSTVESVLSTVDAVPDIHIQRFPTELALIDAFVSAVKALDPDIIMGFEVQVASLGYLSERAAAAFERPHLLRQLSRMPEERTRVESTEDAYGQDHASGLHIAGRVVFNVWRVLRGELKLGIYTLENCAASVLRLRIPHIPPHQLAAWFKAGPAGGRWKALRHLALRARASLAMLDRLDVIGRTSELARTFGIDFFSVVSRGSQYRVESMTLRLAHTQNYLALSASPEQVARQPAMEALPLVMEPESGIYTDPVVVLDFQSLYPSMIIAYNLCYTTCLGRVSHAAAAGTTNKVQLGCSEYASPLLDPSTLNDDVIMAPNGVAFFSPSRRPGILPRLLREILETRIMVKAAMKRAGPQDKVLLRRLNARQFGLKLIANVTYGYTAAGFSGRMPMAELADAIVQSGRETLKAAIRMVESHPTWRAKVVYGDTDSLFVQLPGRSKEDAFRIGAEIAAAVTAANPPPVTLKMEKVYQPCALLSKKRYVGAMYESPHQPAFVFDAKGIETARRDSCPAVAKILERSLRILFATTDLSAVRRYLERQWDRILSNRISIADFVFAKEVRLGTYSARAASVPPAALVATRAMAADPRAAPRHGERVPYVVVYGDPGARLIDMVVPPRALVESGGRLRLHALYYITKQILPALERVFSLAGADVRAWFAELPRPQRLLPQKRPATALPLLPGGGENTNGATTSNNAVQKTAVGGSRGGGTIDQFYLSRHCAVCDSLTHASKPLCNQCLTQPQLAAAVMAARWNRLERQYVQLVRVCNHCGGGGGSAIEEGGIVCDSLDCGVYFERRKVFYELKAGSALAQAGLAALNE